MPDKNLQNKIGANKRLFSTLRRPSPLSKTQLAVFVLAFSLIGYLIFLSFATAPVVATLQAEQMTPSGVNSSSSFTTSLTNGMSLSAPYMWTFSPGVATSAGYFFADGKQLAKINGPGPYALRLSSGLLSSGTHQLGHAWDTTSGVHQTPPSAYTVSVSNSGSTGFVTSLIKGSTINPPYVWAFDPGVATTAGYFFADGKQLAKITGSGPYIYTITPGSLSLGSHKLGHAWDTATGTHQTPNGSYGVTVGSSTSPVSNYSIINDSSASGGQAVKFGGGVSLSGPVSLSAAGTSLVVSAHGEQCSGAWPQMSVAIDGSIVINTLVSSTAWTNYTASVNLTSGIHTLVIKNTTTGSCIPNLYADVTNFYGQTAPPPAPTLALSASPTSLTAGQSSTLTWTSTNATACTASGAWSGTEPTSGSLSTGALNQTSTYGLTCTGNGGSATASATVTVSAPISSYDTAIAYSQTRPAFTPARTVNVTDATSFKNAITNLQPGDLVKATASFTVTGETVINKRLSSTAVIDLSAYPVYFVYNSGQNLPAVWLNNTQNLNIYGGDLSTADTGGTCLLDYGSQHVLWWGFKAHDCGGHGVGIMPIGATADRLDFQGTIWSVGHNLAWDPHTEKGSGLHGALMWDTDNSYGLTNSRFAFDEHDIPVGACVEWGNGTVAPAGGNTLYLRCVNETFVSLTQTGGNAIQFWGDTSNLGVDIKYLEGDNLQGFGLYAGGVYSGQNLSGVTVEYGRATNTNLNPRYAGQNPWDATKGAIYQNVSPAPVAGKL